MNTLQKIVIVIKVYSVFAISEPSQSTFVEDPVKNVAVTEEIPRTQPMTQQLFLIPCNIECEKFTNMCLTEYIEPFATLVPLCENKTYLRPPPKICTRCMHENGIPEEESIPEGVDEEGEEVEDILEEESTTEDQPVQQDDKSTEESITEEQPFSRNEMQSRFQRVGPRRVCKCKRVQTITTRIVSSSCNSLYGNESRNESCDLIYPGADITTKDESFCGCEKHIPSM